MLRAKHQHSSLRSINQAEINAGREGGLPSLKIQIGSMLREMNLERGQATFCIMAACVISVMLKAAVLYLELYL